MSRRRLAWSAAVAWLLVAIPATPVFLMGYTRYRPSLLLFLFLKWRVVYLLVPGFIVYALSAPLKPFFLRHPGALPIMPLLSVIVSAAFWTIVIHLLLSAVAYLRSRHHRPQG